MVKQDYLMRLIHEMVRTIIKLIFNIDEKDSGYRTGAEGNIRPLYKTGETGGCRKDKRSGKSAV